MHKFITYLQIQIIMLLLWLVDFKIQTKEFFKQWWENITEHKDYFIFIVKAVFVVLCFTSTLWLINQWYYGWCSENLWNSYAKLALLYYFIPFQLIICLSVGIFSSIPIKIKELDLPKVKIHPKLKPMIKYTKIGFYWITSICVLCFIIFFLYGLYLLYTHPSC